MYSPEHRALSRSSSLQTLPLVHTHAINWQGRYAYSAHTIAYQQPLSTWGLYQRLPVAHHLVVIKDRQSPGLGLVYWSSRTVTRRTLIS